VLVDEAEIRENTIPPLNVWDFNQLGITWKPLFVEIE